MPTFADNAVIPNNTTDNLSGENFSVLTLTVGTNSTLTIAAGSSLAIEGGTNNGTISGAGTVNFIGVAIGNNGTISVSSFNVNVGTGGNKILTGNGAFVGNLLTIANTVTIALQNNHQFNEISIGSNASLDATSRTVSLRGPNPLQGTGSFTNTFGTMIFDGNLPQTISRSQNFNNLTINNPAGVTFGNTGFYFFSGTLDLSHGILNVGTNPLTFDNAATATRTNGYVIGGITKRFFAAGLPAFTYPLGTANGYSPVTIEITSGTTEMTASVFETNQPILNPAASLRRYWNLNNANGISIAPITVSLTIKPKPAVSISVNPYQQLIVAGQSTFYDIAIKRTNFDAALMLSAENLPTGVTVQFEPAATTGNSSRMYLYSNGLPFFQNEFSMIVRVKDIGDTVQNWTNFSMVVNCGIVWAEQFPTPDAQAMHTDRATAVTYDAAGNVYAAGDTGTTNNIWVAKFDRYGSRQWLQSADLSRIEEHATEIAVDGAGNVYVAGYFRTGSSFVNFDAFIVKFSSSGTFIDSRALGNNYEDGSGGVKIGFDAAGRVMLTAVTDIRNSGVLNYGIERIVLNSNFTVISHTNLLREKPGNPNDFAIAPDGSIHIVGIDQAGQRIVGFADKFNASGDLIWRETFSGGFGGKVVLDSPNNVFLTLFDSLGQSTLMRFGATHRSGTPPDWLHREAVGRSVQIKGLAVDKFDNIFFCGDVTQNGWISKHSGSNGAQLFRHEFGVMGADSFNAIVAGENDEVFIAGDTFNFKNVNFGDKDALVMKYTLSYCLPH